MVSIKSQHFITDNFMLQSEIAQTLFHQYAKDSLLIDYHNYLSVKQIVEDKPINDAIFNKVNTIAYNLNPSQKEVFATMTGNYSESGVLGKMQWGSRWWFLDQKDGIQKQLNCLSNMGLLSRFEGMLTNSRSFLSFLWHEYFRRFLYHVLADDVKQGLVPNDIDFLGKMVQDVCYYNAKNYIKFTIN